MALGRLIRRTAPLIALGVAGAVAARRRAERERAAQLAPTPQPAPPPPVEPEPEPDPEPEPLPDAMDEQPTQETAIERAPWLEPEADAPAEPDLPAEPDAEEASVTEIVDDLLAPGEQPDAIEDATVVDGSVVDEAPNDDPDR